MPGNVTPDNVTPDNVTPDNVMPGLTRHLINPGIAGQARNDGGFVQRK